MFTGASAFPDLGPIDVGKARRTGQAFTPAPQAQDLPQPATALASSGQENGTGAPSSAAFASRDASSNGASSAVDDAMGAEQVRELQLVLTVCFDLEDSDTIVDTTIVIAVTHTPCRVQL